MKLLFILLATSLFSQAYSSRQRRGIGELVENNPIGVENLVDISPSQASISCGYDRVEITINTTYLNALNYSTINTVVLVNSSDVSLGNQCQLQGGGIKFFIGLQSQFGQCASSIQNIGNLLYVNYTVCVVPSFPPGAVYSRDLLSIFSFSCVYPTQALVGGILIRPERRKLILPPQTNSTQLALNFWRYNDSAFTYRVPGNQSVVYATYPVYYRVALNNGNNSGFIVQLNKCWVTPTADPQGSIKFYILIDGCPTSDPMAGFSNNIYTNFATYYGTFSFYVFVWTHLPIDNNQTAYVHCEVNLCHAPSSANCANPPVCGSALPAITRRRRRAVFKTRSSQIISGPAFSIRPLTCDKQQMGCSHECVIVAKGKNICTCPSGMTLGKDLKTCYEVGRKMLQDKTLLRSTSIFVPSNRFPQLSEIIFVVAVFLLIYLVWLYKNVVKPMKAKAMEKENLLVY